MTVGSIVLLAKPNSYRLAAFQRAAISVGADYRIGLDTPAGFVSADTAVIPLSFANPQECLTTIQNRLRQTRAGAIIAVDDGAAELAEFLRSELNLPFNGRASAGRDKSEMRQLFATAGLPGPKLTLLSPADDPLPHCHAIGYPVVIKPTMLNGSRGVIRVDNDDQVRTAFARVSDILFAEGFAPADPCLLIEEFIPGFEVALEGVMADGELIELALFDKPDPLDGPFFEETIYVTPSRLPDVVQYDIRATVEQMARAVGIRQSPVHAELRVNEKGVWPLEIAARSIGGQCSSVLSFGSGASLEEIIIRSQLGLPIDERRTGDAAVGVMMIPIPQTGILHAVDGLENAKRVAGVTDIQITAPLHQPIVALPEGASYLGFIFASADLPEDVERVLRLAHAELAIDISPMLSLRPV